LDITPSSDMGWKDISSRRFSAASILRAETRIPHRLPVVAAIPAHCDR